MRTQTVKITALLALIPLCGCSTGPILFGNNECHSGAEPGSAQWWAERAQAPPGARNVCHKGKMWPVRPRPTGEKQQFTHAYHSQHYWPLPYVCQDRAYVKNINDIQVGNGWKQETTLYDRHFAEDDLLNVPGKLHLIDILEVTPSKYRTVYVQSTYDTNVDNIRLSNVQAAISELTNGTETVSVLTRRGRDYSRPASEVQAINDLYNSSLPQPRISGSGGGGGTAGSAPSIGGP